MATTEIDFGFSIGDPETYLPTIMRVGKYTIGTGSPAEQIVSAVVVLVGALVSTTLTLGATAVLVLLTLPFLALGFLRLIPAINRLWPWGGA